MKRKLKGFTLIELIVVIAIIGILAAILVPSMLGYVKKAKIQGANTNASTLHKAITAYIDDLDAEKGDFLADGIYSIDGGLFIKKSNSEAVNVKRAMKIYFPDIDKVDGAFYVKSYECVAVSIKNKQYYGTYPSFLTAKNWDSYKEAGKLGSSISVVEQAVIANKIEKADYTFS